MPEQFCGFAHRQAHDGGITAIQARHKHRSQALNGVATGFVQGFTAGPIQAGFLFADVSKAYLTAYHSGFTAPGVNNRDRGQHLMLPARQRHEHSQGVGLVDRFTENVFIEHHGRVSPQYAKRSVRHGRQQLLAPGLGLFARQALDIGHRGFIREGSFVNGCADRFKRHADLSQQLASAR